MKNNYLIKFNYNNKWYYVDDKYKCYYLKNDKKVYDLNKDETLVYDIVIDSVTPSDNIIKLMDYNNHPVYFDMKTRLCLFDNNLPVIQ